jgi:hypothetical protein
MVIVSGASPSTYRREDRIECGTLLIFDHTAFLSTRHRPQQAISDQSAQHFLSCFSLWFVPASVAMYWVTKLGQY